MRRVVIVLITLLAAVALAAPAGASSNLTSASTPSGTIVRTITTKASVVPTSTAGMSCSSSPCFAAAGNDAIVKVVLPTRFTSVTNVDVTLNFPIGDAFDPCDVINLAVDGAGGSTGQILPCDSFLGLRTLTIHLPDVGPPFTDMLAQFTDGRARLQVWMGTGSATISSATVTVTGS